MAPNRIFTDALDACLKPRLVELESNLIAASFDLMKLIPAKFILDQAKIMAKTNGHETPRPIIEISSGLFGLALAIACCVKGHRLTLVCGSDVNQALVARMTGLGAEIEKLEAPSFSPDFSRTSADFIEEARANNPGAFYPSHNNNPQNPGSYSSLAELLLEAIGNVDCLIGPVETGGSLRGTGTYMRLVKPELHIVAVDSLNSVLFGRRAGPLFVPGLGNACMPMNLDHSVFDEVHWVSDGEALCAARTLERERALEKGGSSGAAYMVAKWWAKNNPNKKVVVLLPANDSHYSSPSQDIETLRNLSIWTDKVPDAPVELARPEAQAPSWSYVLWQKKKLSSWST